MHTNKLGELVPDDFETECEDPRNAVRVVIVGPAVNGQGNAAWGGGRTYEEASENFRSLGGVITGNHVVYRAPYHMLFRGVSPTGGALFINATALDGYPKNLPEAETLLNAEHVTLTGVAQN